MPTADDIQAIPDLKLETLAAIRDPAARAAFEAIANLWPRLRRANQVTRVAVQAAGAHPLLAGSIHTDTVAQGVTRGSIPYGNSTPAWDELVKGSAGQFLQSGATDVSWVSLSGDATLSAGVITIANDAVSNAKLADMVQTTVKGRAAAAGTGDPTDLTAAQLIAIIATAAGAGSGLDADLLDGQSSAAFAAAMYSS